VWWTAVLIGEDSAALASPVIHDARPQDNP
jgi:hypothetical protein